MYLTFIAMLMHFAQPSYEEILVRIRAQQYIHPLKMAQLCVEENLFFSQELPEFIPQTKTASYDLQWDGQSYQFYAHEDDLTLNLDTSFDDQHLKWDCHHDLENKIGEYLCRVLTR